MCLVQSLLKYKKIFVPFNKKQDLAECFQQANILIIRTGLSSHECFVIEENRTSKRGNKFSKITTQARYKSVIERKYKRFDIG